jgi:predicted nucleic acid-binding protein
MIVVDASVFIDLLFEYDSVFSCITESLFNPEGLKAGICFVRRTSTL